MNNRWSWLKVYLIVVLLFSAAGFDQPGRVQAHAQAQAAPVSAVQAQPDKVLGPFSSTAQGPFTFEGDLRSLPLADLTQTTPALPRRSAPPLPAGITLLQSPAPAGQPQAQAPAAVNMPAPIVNFQGLGPGGNPPDTNGDVGPNHYIQAINTSFAIYNKSGTLLSGPTSFHALFAASPATNTPCDNQFNSDPIVLYDAMADRWVLTILAFHQVYPIWTGNLYECIAVSRTSDPVSGGWYKYALVADASLLNDYPKLSVWPDAYYMTANMYNTAHFDHSRVWALDRSAMLNGGTLSEVHFELPSNYFSLLPANVRGTPPPAGRPNYVMAADYFSSNVLHLWRFHVDFATPANSWFGTSSGNSNPVNITVSSYTYPSSGVPQQGTVVPLDSLADRLMYSLQYRNLNGTEVLWADQSVKENSQIGIRWYEIRSPNGTPTVHQSGDFGGDGVYRWMGGLGVDRFGNMALGYSVSNSSMYAGIRYAGRLASDTLGTLPQGEGTLASGTDYLTDCITCTARYGDYSAMTVDPVDDCTFWYTNEYPVATHSYRTRIGSFKFPACSNLIVDRSDDADVHACTSAANDCTLRGAINLLNGGGFAGATVTFAPAVTKVDLSNTLPTIDTGASHNAIQGSSGVPRIDGVSMTTGDIFVLNADDFRLSGLSVVNGVAPYSDIYVPGGTHSVIANNYLGTLPPSASVTNCKPSPASGAVTRNSGYGVFVGGGVAGSSTANDGALYINNNTIGCHSATGVYLYGSDYVRVGEDANGLAAGNRIGVNVSGVIISNTQEGVALVANGTDGAINNIVRGNVIASNGIDGVWLNGTGTNNTNSTATNHIAGNQIANNGRHGVLLYNGAFWNEVGSDQDADRNLIYGNGGDGVHLTNSSLNGILGNSIGSVAGGNPNNGNGILVDGGDSNLIGSMYVLLFVLERGNVISGNKGDGVQLTNGTSGNLLTWNFIGTNISGTVAIPNLLSGVSLLSGAHNNTIGADLKRNLIAGNAGVGVYIAGSTTATNTLNYNDIGINSSPGALSVSPNDRAAAPQGGGGWLAVPNGSDGIALLSGTHNNVITDSTYSSANHGSGIYVAGGSHDNSLYNVALFSNALYGAILDGSGTTDNTFVKSSYTVNGYDGIGERNSATDNRWSQIQMAQNGGLGIDKSASSDFSNTITPPVPVITSVIRAGGVITISGTANGTYSDLSGYNTAKVEVYTVWPNASGFGEGFAYKGVATTDSLGNWQMVLPAATGSCYTAFETSTGRFLLTNFWNYSSEFGPNSCRTFLPAVLK